MSKKINLSALLLCLSAQAFSHGNHVETGGVSFQLAPQRDAVIFQNMSARKLAKLTKKFPNTFRLQRPDGISLFKPGSEDLNSKPTLVADENYSLGQVFLDVNDFRTGRYTIPMIPSSSYTSHDAHLGHSSMQVGDIERYTIPKRVLTTAVQVEIKIVREDGIRLLHRIDFLDR